MTARLMTQADFARHRGVSRKTVTVLKQDDCLVMVDGLVDVAASDYLIEQRGRLRNASPPASIAEPSPPSAPDGGSPMSADEFADRVLGGVAVDRKTAEQFKEGALALKGLLAAQREAGAIVDIEVAETVIFETFRGIRDSWLNWPSRVGPLIAADLGLEPERLVRVLTEHVNRHLRDLGEPEPDFDVET